MSEVVAAALAELRGEIKAMRAEARRPAQRLLGAAHAAKYLGVSRELFYRLVNDGEIPPGVRLGTGKKAMHDIRQLDAYIDRQHGRKRKKVKRKAYPLPASGGA